MTMIVQVPVAVQQWIMDPRLATLWSKAASALVLSLQRSTTACTSTTKLIIQNMLTHLSKRDLTTLTTRMIYQYIEVKMAVLLQATLINAMDSHATMMMTASAVAVDISFPSRSKDVFPSLTMNFAHDS